jgi:P27 family predicted phage terminase small subunit
MRGRKPKPTQQRILEGNPSGRRLNVDEPRPPAPSEAPQDAPAEFEGLPLALAEWRRLMPMLTRLRVVSEADRGALVALCLEWSRYVTATQEIRRKGMIIAAPNGYPIVNPYLSIATRALAGCTKLWPELGLTPSSRSRVTAGTGGFGSADDPFSEFDTPPAAKPS